MGSPGALSSTTQRDPGQGAGGPSEPPALPAFFVSRWGWRTLAVLSMVALGLCITFFGDGHSGYGVVWAIITLGWGALTLMLWRRHLAEDAARHANG